MRPARSKSDLEVSAVCMMENSVVASTWIGRTQKTPSPRQFGSGRLFGDNDLNFVCLGSISGGRSRSSKENYPDKEGAEVPRRCHSHRTDALRIEWSRWNVS
jgi:hypothetical protein